MGDENILEPGRVVGGLSQCASDNEPTCQSRRHKRWQVQSLDREDPPEKGMATHSSILA